MSSITYSKRGAVFSCHRDDKQACAFTLVSSARRPSLDASYHLCVRGAAVLLDFGARACRPAVDKLFSRQHLSGKRGLNAVPSGAGE